MKYYALTKSAGKSVYIMLKKVTDTKMKEDSSVRCLQNASNLANPN